MRKITILGSTGSIGTQTLDVIDHLENFEVVALTANKNIEIIQRQIQKYKPKIVAVLDEEKAAELTYRFKNIKVLAGSDGITEAAKASEADIVVNALVGSAGLLPTMAAINAGKDVALANKETLVCAGGIIMPLAKERGVNVYPIDSEHSAIFQCLAGNARNKPKTIYLTASGGPFRAFTKEQMSGVTVKDALKHPKWEMGQKITIDSATMMNKGLEVIEAKWLFDMRPDDIQVLVHPQSVIHSMVEFKDNAVMAQLGEPDMRIPIQYALTCPDRQANGYKRINFFDSNNLTFERPDFERFPCLTLAYEAIKKGGFIPAVLNGANESAVSLFLMEKISFTDIPVIIESAVNAYNSIGAAVEYTIENVLSADKWAKDFVFGLTGGE